ncbi:MAG: PKD domain-containing protein [Saccharospirillaceae bacterium]|nr:PKD domain-containing protein [Pseudomonadales bacterium]NRB79887.1 PKD domain-containing protein [Saccharospirillaceae bacterium]
MKNLAIVVSAISALTLTSCFENLNIPGFEDSQTETSVATDTFTFTDTSPPIQTDCSLIQSHIDFTFDVDDSNNFVAFDASASNYSECLIDKQFDSFTWDFGDSTVIQSNSALTFHQYPNNGLYSVTLTASYEDSYISTTREVAVNDLQACDALISNAHFTTTYDSSGFVLFDASSSYLFEDCQYHDIKEYIWDFGNGDIITSEGNVFTYELNPSGFYPVTLSISHNNNVYTHSELIVFDDTQTQTCLDNSLSFNYQISDSSTIRVDASDIQITENCTNEPILEYVWEMGDGTVYEGVGNVLSHTYNNAGSYPIMLTVFTANDVYSFLEFIEFGFSCIENPHSIFESLVDGNNVLFDASMSIAGPACEINASDNLTYQWFFGDGNITNTADSIIQHQYQNTGAYIVTLTVSNNQGLSHDYSNVIIIDSIISECEFNNPQDNIESYVHELTATFDASEVFGYGCNGQYPMDEYLWNFGDGTSAVTSAPFVNHTYHNNNEYIVSVSNSENIAALTDVQIEYYMICTDDIPTSYCSSPSPALTVQASPLELYSNNILFELTDHSYNSDENTYSWLSSDAQTGTGDTFNTHFSEAGYYEILLKAKRKNGEVFATVIQFEKTHQVCGVLDYPITIAIKPYDIYTDYNTSTSIEVDSGIVIEYPIYKANNNIELVPTAETGNQIRFEMLWPTQEPCKTFIWDFGDGHLLETSNFKVTHEYALPGNYSVKVWDGYDDGFIEITVGGNTTCETPPLATFTSNTNSLTAHFDASQSFTCSDAADVIYEWNFGSGEIIESNSPYISHTYQYSRDYTVTLWIQGTNTFYSKNISIEKVAMEMTYDYQSTELEFVFNAHASTFSPMFEPIPVIDIGTDTNTDLAVYPAPYPLDEFYYEWDFGDGYTATGQNVNHIYQTPGGYFVSITATNFYTQESIVKQFHVSAQYDTEPEVLTLDLETVNHGLTIDFLAIIETNFERNYPINLLYFWDFGDGNHLYAYNLKSIQHTYQHPGVYEVTLTVDETGSNLSATQRITVVVTE